MIKVSLGAEKHVSFEHVKSISGLINRLKNKGFKILALEQHKKSKPLFDFKPKNKEKYALIAGAETKGLPDSILKRADKVLEIPMAGCKESLNVAVALGIAIFHSTRV